MDACTDPSPLKQLICVIEGIRPNWWEPWVQVASVVLSVLVPVLIAVWVSRRGRTTTLEAVNLQIESDREERRHDILRERVTTLAGVAARQHAMGPDDWKTEFVALSTAVVNLSMAMPWNIRDKLDSWLMDQLPALVKIRTEEPGKSDRLNSWSSQIRTVCDMILTEQSVELILQIIEWMNDNPDSPANESPSSDAESAPDK